VIEADAAAADDSAARAAFVCPRQIVARRGGDMPAITPEDVVQVRRDYAAGERVSQIAAKSGLSKALIYYCLDGGPPDAAGQRLPQIQRRRFSAPRPARINRARAQLVDRLWRTASKQVRDIEKRLRLDQEPDARERDARMLATMVKTLRELRALDAARTEQEPSEDEHGPDNLDDFRRDLARKIDAIVAGRRASPAGDAGP